MRRALPRRSCGLEPPHVVQQSPACIRSTYEDDAPIRQRNAGVAVSCRPPGIRQPGPGCAAVGRPPHVILLVDITVQTARKHDAAVRQRNAGVRGPCRPPGARVHARPGRAEIGRLPYVVVPGGVVRPAHEDDLPVRQRDAAVLVAYRPPGTRIHLRPGGAGIRRPPHVVQRLIETVVAAHEDNAPVRQHSAGMKGSCRPPGTRVHLSPCGAVVGRPPHVVQRLSRAVAAAHQDDTAVRQRNTGMFKACRPPGMFGLPRPGGAIVSRLPCVVQIVGVTPTAHEDDAAVRQRNAGGIHTCRPPGIVGLLRPGFIIRLVAEEPDPPGRIAGRCVGEAHGQGRQAGGRRTGERRCRRDRCVGDGDVVDDRRGIVSTGVVCL